LDPELVSNSKNKKMNYFIAVTFEGKKTARKVLNKIEDNAKAYIWYEEGDYAVVSVNQKGHIRVHSTWAQDSITEPGSVGLGVIAGGILGLMLGPGGALAGAVAGGSMGGLIGKKENINLTDPQLKAFADSLINDTSGIVLIGPSAAIDEFKAELEGFEVEMFETAIDDALLKDLKQVLKK
jgi:uncharacterized membrane protein